MDNPLQSLDKVLLEATLIVDAEVLKIVSTGPEQPKDGAEAPVAAQVVKLSVKSLIRGKAPRQLLVEKPLAPYSLRPGSNGVFLLKAGGAHPTILGRYGPDTYTLKAVKAQLGLR